LLVHPGPDIIQRAGGVHKFMDHDGPIITDSGGFQIYSLAAARDGEEVGPELKSRSRGRKLLQRMDQDGALFRSYLDGTLINLTPESSIAAQKAFGSDIIIPLDDLPPLRLSRELLAQSVALSHQWEARSLRAHLSDPRGQAIYGVIHGGTDHELRSQSAEYISSLPFDGLAIGGSLGADRSEMISLLTWLMPKVPRDRPNHLLGIADEASCRAVVELGVDTMDSCNPTRMARHGTLMTTEGNLNIKGLKHADDFGPIDPETPSIPHSRAYLHHLFRQNEPLALTLGTLHNLYYMHNLMARLRQSILNDEV